MTVLLVSTVQWVFRNTNASATKENTMRDVLGVSSLWTIRFFASSSSISATTGDWSSTGNPAAFRFFARASLPPQ
jgi:hypothetical protein